jgi:hypothetical protein
MKTVVILEVTHDKPLPESLPQQIAGRAFTLNGISDVSVIDVIDDLALQAVWGKIEASIRNPG